MLKRDTLKKVESSPFVYQKSNVVSILQHVSEMKLVFYMIIFKFHGEKAYQATINISKYNITLFLCQLKSSFWTENK